MKAAAVSVKVNVESAPMYTPLSMLTNMMASDCLFSNVVDPELGKYEIPLCAWNEQWIIRPEPLKQGTCYAHSIVVHLAETM